MRNLSPVPIFCYTSVAAESNIVFFVNCESTNPKPRNLCFATPPLRKINPYTFLRCKKMTSCFCPVANPKPPRLLYNATELTPHPLFTLRNASSFRPPMFFFVAQLELLSISSLGSAIVLGAP